MVSSKENARNYKNGDENNTKESIIEQKDKKTREIAKKRGVELKKHAKQAESTLPGGV